MSHICPWWLTYTFDNPLRRLIQNPQRILRSYVKPGMAVADVGCGMGYFTLSLAEFVGETGKVYAVDLQEQQLRRVQSRAGKAGLTGRLELVQATSDSLQLKVPVDFVLAHWMVHEVPSQREFLSELMRHLKPSGTILVAEPKIHVSRAAFEKTLDVARKLGLRTADPGTPVPLSHSVVLTRG